MDSNTWEQQKGRNIESKHDPNDQTLKSTRTITLKLHLASQPLKRRSQLNLQTNLYPASDLRLDASKKILI